MNVRTFLPALVHAAALLLDHLRIRSQRAIFIYWQCGQASAHIIACEHPFTGLIYRYKAGA